MFMNNGRVKYKTGKWLAFVFIVFGCFIASLTIQAAEIPSLVTNNGRHALMVDGEPFLILGVQANNSANYPAALKDVWPTLEKMHANTLSIPVAWEQIEPEEGRFDFSYVDYLVKEARKRDLRLNLLWFATWKNNAPHFAPAWVKLDNKRFPRVVKQDGDTLNSLSPLFRSTLEADKKAFVELIKHIKKIDKKHTVILMQVENEVGTYGSVRDFSPTAQKAFNAPVPADLVKKLNVKPGTWSQVFGKDADEFFHAYHIAVYVDEIAAAGKAIKPLPMNVNVALRNPFNPGLPGQYSSGGPTDNVLDIWKAAAPNIDMISPDIYFRDYKAVDKVLELYSRPDNALFVAEIGNDQPFARYFFSTLGYQGIGFAPFGMDNTDYSNYPLGAKKIDDETIEAFAQNYRLLKPMAREWAKLSFENRVWGVAEPVDTNANNEKIWNAEATPEEIKSEAKKNAANYTQRLDVGLWDAEVTYGRPMFWIDPPVGNTPSSGGVIIAQLSDNEYLVTGYRARVTFSASAELNGKKYMIERVEEGHFENGKWVFERVWNGDQTDWGLNFTSRMHVLKVRMAAYETH
jgi:beta-galactosidase GanA